jgi:DNA-binding MarR family transcriptional regulator
MPNIPPVKLTLFGGGPKSRANYQLTAMGKTKAEQINVSGTKGEVVMALESIGPCTLSEIANETKMSPTHVKQVMQVLIRDGWARKVTGEE